MISGSALRPVSFAHVIEMSGRYGMFEHARGRRPALEHGYSLDDNGRALVVAARATGSGIEFPLSVGEKCLDFVLRAEEDQWKDRRSSFGMWSGSATDDAVGRAIWGLGAAAGWWSEFQGREKSEEALTRSLMFESQWWRSCAYALLGFTGFFDQCPSLEVSATVERLALCLPTARRPADGWLWPEDHLRYDNARLPEALIACGQTLDDSKLIEEGLRLLGWLVETEMGERGFSFTPVAGRGVGARQPAFDQQPLEAWAMADACVRALWVTGDRSWAGLADLAISWFLGENDQGLALYDTESGGCFDGLTADGVNANQGAESTLAALGSMLSLGRPPGLP